MQLSCCHNYHAASLIRFFLNIKDEVPTKTSVTLLDKLTRYNSRIGFIEPAIINSEQKITILNFGNKTAIYDFNFEQYFSDIRASRIVIRETKGEIINNTCTYLKDGLPHLFVIKRNCFGHEEIAIVTYLYKMKDFCLNNISFYSATDAFLDYKLF